MSRTPAVVLSCVFAIQPSGWALPNAADSMWANFLAPMCAQWSALEAQAEQFGPEIDPRTTVLLLPEWQALMGPDPCGRDQLLLSQSDQQSLVYQRYTSRGGQSIAYYTALAAKMGVSISVREGTWSRAGMMRAGTPVSAPGNQFNWQVALPQTRLVPFRSGASQAGNPLGAFTPNLVQCAIAIAAPAHTNVGFDYVASIVGGSIGLEDGDGSIALEGGDEIILETT